MVVMVEGDKVVARGEHATTGDNSRSRSLSQRRDKADSQEVLGWLWEFSIILLGRMELTTSSIKRNQSYTDLNIVYFQLCQ